MKKDIIEKSLDFGISHLEELVSRGLIHVGAHKDDNEEYISVILLEGSSVKGLPIEYEGTSIRYEFMSQEEYDSIPKWA